MEDNENRYCDFSEDAGLLRHFDPEQAEDPLLAISGSILQTHLSWRNPSTRIAGLIANESIAQSARHNARISQLQQIKWLLFAGVSVLGYIAFVIS